MLFVNLYDIRDKDQTCVRIGEDRKNLFGK